MYEIYSKWVALCLQASNLAMSDIEVGHRIMAGR